MLASRGPLAVAGRPGAEVGPVEALLHWGAQVAEVDLPGPPVQARVLGMAPAPPTNLFAVPADAVAPSARAYAARSRTAKLAGSPRIA